MSFITDTKNQHVSVEANVNLKIKDHATNKIISSTYVSTGETVLQTIPMQNCLNKMINPNTLSMRSQDILKLLKPANEEQKEQINCYLIQNFQLLLDEIPQELLNLPYGVYPNQQSLYNDARFIYNKLLNYFPHAIFYPHNIKEISYLIKWLTKYNLKFALRCGGHSYEAASLSSGYIINVTKLPSYVIVNKNRTSVRVSAGLKLGYIIEELAKHSLITTTGENACVGVSGLSLAGGKGNLTRIYGLTCDNILSLKMINDKGEMVTANANTNSDLFWACKGAGPCNFGVITEIELKVYEDIYVQIETLTWTWNSDHAKEIYNLYQEWILDLPDKITGDFNMTFDNKNASFKIKFKKFGKSDFTENNIFKKLYNPSITYCQGFYSQILDCWVDFDKGLNPPFSKIKSNMVFKPINQIAINTLVESIDYYLTKGYKINYQINFSQLGGAVKKGDSSYFPKDAIMVLSYFMQWSYPELTDILKYHLKKIYDKVKPFTSIYCFPNLIDYDLKDYMLQYYGNNQNKLRKIKKKYDPQNKFKYFQSIPIKKPII